MTALHRCSYLYTELRAPHLPLDTGVTYAALRLQLPLALSASVRTAPLRLHIPHAAPIGSSPTSYPLLHTPSISIFIHFYHFLSHSSLSLTVLSHTLSPAPLPPITFLNLLISLWLDLSLSLDSSLTHPQAHSLLLLSNSLFITLHFLSLNQSNSTPNQFSFPLANPTSPSLLSSPPRSGDPALMDVGSSCFGWMIRFN